MKFSDLSPAKIMEDLSVARYDHYLKTGEYPDGKFNKT